MSIAYIAFGSNVGNAREIFGSALKALEYLGVVRQRSRLYLTKPCGYSAQPDFTNAAVCLETHCSPQALIGVLQQIEKQCGKTIVCENGPRTLDLDLLYFDSIQISTTELILPHPRAHERDFVLLPMCDLSHDFQHPVFQQTMHELLSGLTTFYFTGKVEIW